MEELSDKIESLLKMINDKDNEIKSLKEKEGKFAEWLSIEGWGFQTYYMLWYNTNDSFNVRGKTTSELMEEYERFNQTK